MLLPKLKCLSQYSQAQAQFRRDVEIAGYLHRTGGMLTRLIHLLGRHIIQSPCALKFGPVSFAADRHRNLLRFLQAGSCRARRGTPQMESRHPQQSIDHMVVEHMLAPQGKATSIVLLRLRQLTLLRP